MTTTTIAPDPIDSARTLARRVLAALLALLVAGGVADAGTARPVAAGPVASACAIGTPGVAFSGEVLGSPRPARVWRLYQAYFLRQPDRGGLDYWVGQSRVGLSLQLTSDLFQASDEFRARYGSVDDAAFVTLVYQNVLCRQPDAAGFGYWVDLLQRGEIGRGELMVLFSESAEYGLRTGTRWSIFDDPMAASIASDGYAVRPIGGGLVVEADYQRVDFLASDARCSIASINGNWFHTPERPDPTPIGFAVIDGVRLPGSVNSDDRGVLGERRRPGGPDIERVWNYQGSFNLNSNLAVKGELVLESWRSWQPASTPPLDNASEWRWAAAGIPLVVNGQVWEGFAAIPTNDYTHYTTRHSFVAFDKGSGRLAFGTTTAMTSAQLIDWAVASGYEDLVKFDGGGSAELNVGGRTRVAGTGRDVPLWLGIGC